MNLQLERRTLPFSKIFFNYFAVYTLTGFSGTFFFPYKDVIFVILLLLFAFIFFKRKLGFDKNFLIFFFYCVLIVIGQSVIFSSFSIIGITRGFMTFVFAYLVIKLVGISFTKYLINIIYFFTIISFIFYIPSLLSPSFHAYLATVADKLGTDVFGYNVWGHQGNNFIIYTWRDWTSEGLLRNTGNYSEAGVFGSVLVLILILNVIEKKVWLSRKNIVFILAIITTFSTSSYIALNLFIFFWISLRLPWRWKIILYPLIIYVSIYLFTNLPFLKDKIEYQYTTQVEDKGSSGRFSSAMFDLKDIARYPLTGRGFSKETRTDIKDWEGGSNGITGLAVTIAPVGFLIYMLFMFKSFSKYCVMYKVPKNFSYIILGIILVLAFAQYILSTPLLYSFVFYGSLIKFRINYNETIPFNHYAYL